MINEHRWAFKGFIDQDELPDDILNEKKGLVMKLGHRPFVDSNVNNGASYDSDTFKQAMEKRKGWMLPIRFHCKNLEIEAMTNVVCSFDPHKVLGYILYVTRTSAYIVVPSDETREIIINHPNYRLFFTVIGMKDKEDDDIYLVHRISHGTIAIELRRAEVTIHG